MHRLATFIDFWNFQLNWNDRTNKARLDWKCMAGIIQVEVKKLISEVEGEVAVEYQGIRIFASINPKSEGDKRLKSWLCNTLGQMPGYLVSITERTARKKPIHCGECDTEIIACPNCSKPFQRAPEKGVDSAIITDMFSLHIENVYDIAVLASSDADMIPMVRYLQNRGVKIINLSWDGIGNELKRVCWASVNLNHLETQLIIV